MILLAISAPVLAQDANLRGPIMLTISGAIEAPSRGAISPDFDMLFTYNEIEFDVAAQFDFAMLESLDVKEIVTDFPLGEAIHRFEGPTLESVLEAAEAQVGPETTLILTGLDGYAIEVSYSEIVSKGAILAYRRDGALFALGDFGPTQVIFPRQDRAELADMVDDWWVWSVFHIHVE